MAGHNGGRAGCTKRWRESYWKRIDEAECPEDRLAAAYDLLRTALARCATPDQRDRIIASAMADLAGPAEELLASYEHGRRGA